MAEEVSDDALVCVFKALTAPFCSPCTSQSAHKAAAHRFVWLRTTLPAVCRRWRRLALDTPGLWGTCVLDPSAEAHHARRSGARGGEPGGSSPRGAGSGFRSGGAAGGGYGWPPGSGSSTPARGASPVLGSSPDDSYDGGYWSSHFSPYKGLPGSSPPGPHQHHLLQQQHHLLTRQQLLSLSLSRQHHVHTHQRGVLSAAAATSWLQRHPAVASSVTRLVADLGHHSHHTFDGQGLQALLRCLPRLQVVHMAGAVDGTDAYEPLGCLRSLRELELTSASQACLDGGLMALGFLPALRSLGVQLDIQPAVPSCLSDVPAGLYALKLGGMWLEQLPPQMARLTDLTSVVLDRCQVEADPLPLLLQLPQLSSVTVRNTTRPPVLRPMQQPQQQLQQLLQQRQQLLQAGRAQSAGRGGSSGQLARASVGSATGSSGELAAPLPPPPPPPPLESPGGPWCNTSITSLALVSAGLAQLPACVSQLVALRDLNLALNHDMGLDATRCLPAELAGLSALAGLCLGHCGLGQLPPVVLSLTGLTRLELQGNALGAVGAAAAAPTAPAAAAVGFRQSLQVLDLGGHGSTRGRMRGIPGWVGSCHGLRELRLGCHCLGHARGGELRAAAAAAAAANGALAPGASPPGGGAGGPRAGVGQGDGGPGAAAHAAAEELSLGQLPQLLPELEVLRIEGSAWEQRAVHDVLQLVRSLARQGSRLQVVVPA